MANSSPEDLSGRLLEGKYRLIRLLGRGGMGEVYEASHELIGRRLAIKLLHTEYLADDDTVRRFEQEAKVATAIGHEHIVEITDMGRTDQGELFIAMEFLEGTDLCGVLALESRLEPRRACHIAIQVLSALEAAHSKGIVHRDLKPANIVLVSRAGTTDYVKLVDFGISKVRDPRGSLDSGHTRAGELLGTPLYMSPEQALGSADVTHTSDLYSLGVVMYEMLGGELPFRASSLPKLLQKIIREEPPPLASLSPELPPELCDIVTQAISKRPEHRFQSAAGMRRALRKFSPETSLVAGLRTTRISNRMALMQELLHDRGGLSPSPEDQPKVSRRVWSALGIGGFLVALALGFSLWWFVGESALATSPAQREQPSLAKTAAAIDKGSIEASLASPEQTKPHSAATRSGELTVIVDPSDAEISIDGRSLGTGPKESFAIPLDSKAHSVVVKRPGYVSYERKLAFESSLHLTVRLEPEPGHEAARLRAVPGAAERAQATPPRNSGEEKAQNKDGRTKRLIDENAPW